MDARTAAQTTADAVGGITSKFMLDGNTYKRGAELGFAGLDFYVVGRGGVLGDVPAGVVTAAFGFFHPDHVQVQWEQGTAVMSPAEAAVAFAACSETWAAEHVPDDIDVVRLGTLASTMASGARVAGAPVFAGWLTLAVPSDPKAMAVHHLNSLRELRNACHLAGVLASGLSPAEALAIKTPQMGPIFGWAELPEVDGRQELWDRAEAATDRAMAHAYEVLSEPERDEFTELANALHAATS
ncbi:MAG: SCO6745 family protein [Acidimicrobiales bacterium]